MLFYNSALVWAGYVGKMTVRLGRMVLWWLHFALSLLLSMLVHVSIIDRSRETYPLSEGGCLQHHFWREGNQDCLIQCGLSKRSKTTTQPQP